MNKPLLCGLHYHNFPAQAPDKLKALRVPIHLVLYEDAQYYMDLVDDGVDDWYVRFYSGDVMGEGPGDLEERARFWANSVHLRMMELLRVRGGDPKRFVAVGYNELVLWLEHGNREGNPPWDSYEGFVVRQRWMMAFHRHLKSLGGPYRIAGWMESPGHNDFDGRVELRLLGEAGFFDLIDVFVPHWYAEGPDRGGYDDPERQWFSDRFVHALPIVREFFQGPVVIGETNRKDMEVADFLGEFDRYCDRLKAAGVDGVIIFLWSTGNEGAFGTMEVADLMDEDSEKERAALAFFQGIIDRNRSGETPPPPPPPVDPGTPPPPGAPQELDPESLRIAALYNLTIVQGTEWRVVRLVEDLSGQRTLDAYAPEGVCVIRTRDGQWTSDVVEHAQMVFDHGAFYTPESTQGPFEALAGDAKVVGLGWANINPAGNGHNHVDVHFAKAAATPLPEPPPPVEPPPGENPLSPLLGQRILQVWQDADPQEVSEFARQHGFTGVCWKALDGATWMGHYDPRQVIMGLEDIRRLTQFFHGHGLSFGVWTNPLNRNLELQAERTAAIANHVDYVFLDVEPYAGFWGAWQPEGVARDFVRRIREKAPKALLVLQPDPRQGRLDEIRASEWLSECAAYAPQWYWTDMEISPRVVLGAIREWDGPVLPTVPANAGPEAVAVFMKELALLPNVVGAVLWRHGVGGPNVARAFNSQKLNSKEIPMTRAEKETLFADLTVLWQDAEATRAEMVREAEGLEARTKAVIETIKNKLQLHLENG